MAAAGAAAGDGGMRAILTEVLYFIAPFAMILFIVLFIKLLDWLD